ncbi:hypothetical protein GCK72_012571 [Caenorhabditis remanei]|uniref:Potassium channel tetramerisation-type BTB domain-containing protein n=2 Tax=Caenorhabditis remanei TaxID=31234 RepID=A0A6A5GLB4_CAERE|nr:hypothetical protein GCK72_012571 [Caenorhabditis remanei]KAF1756118.1 hypothetical protein GCK72_012571 [Caenorhabditis remanei]
MFETEIPLEKDENGCIFIDRDAKHFRLILNFLRDESSYYLLDGLMHLCQERCNDDRQLKEMRHIENKTELLKTVLHSRKAFLIFFYEPENVVRVENFFNEGVFPATIAHLKKFIAEFESKFDFYYTAGGSEEGWSCVHYKDYNSTFIAAYSWSRDFLDDIWMILKDKEL